jgi:hypothetical protein
MTINTTGADVILYGVGVLGLSGTSTKPPTDGQGLTWHNFTVVDVGASSDPRVFTAYATKFDAGFSTSATHTFKPSGGSSSDFPGECVIALSGTLTSSSPLDGTAAGGGCGSCSSAQPGTIGYSGSSADAFVTFLAGYENNTTTVNGIFTIQSSQTGGSGYSSHIAFGTASASQNPTWTNGGGTNVQRLQTTGWSFLAGGGGGGGPTSHPCGQLTLLGVGCEVHP